MKTWEPSLRPAPHYVYEQTGSHQCTSYSCNWHAVSVQFCHVCRVYFSPPYILSSQQSVLHFMSLFHLGGETIVSLACLT